MRIAAQIGVKDEVDLIGPCLAHLRGQGVGRIWVQDMGSTDGTLEALHADGSADLVVVKNGIAATDADIAAAMLGAVRDAAQWGADWLVMIDADEFILAPGGDLAAALSGIAEPLAMMPRYNVALGPRGLTMPLPPAPADYAGTWMYARADKWYRKKLEADPALAWLRFVPLPKAAVRPAMLGGVVHGMHDAHGPDGTPLARAERVPLVVAHVPLSDYARFARKVDNIAEVFRTHAADTPGNFGWHWKRWMASAEAGALRAEYDASCLDQAELETLRADGTLMSATELLDGAKAHP